MGRARRTERGEEGRKSRKRLERERERGQKGRGGRRKQKQQQLEKPESGRKWGVVNRALAGSPTAPLTAPACSPGLRLHLTATRLAWHHNDGRAMSEAAERPPQQAMRRQAKLEGWKSVSWIGRSYTSQYMGGTPTAPHEVWRSSKAHLESPREAHSWAGRAANSESQCGMANA